MDAAIAFMLAIVVSFFGSVLMGIVNIAVIETAINKNAKAATWLAIGGVIPEIPYTLIAIFGTSYVEYLKQYKSIIGIAIGVVLIILGISYIRKTFKEKDIDHIKVDEKGGLKYLVKGVLLATANPQLIFFWSGFLILIQTGTFNPFKDKNVIVDFNASGFLSPKFSFAIGAAFGALIILLIYIKLSSIYKEKLLIIIGNRLGHIVGGIFILMGIAAIFKHVI